MHAETIGSIPFRLLFSVNLQEVASFSVVAIAVQTRTQSDHKTRTEERDLYCFVSTVDCLNIRRMVSSCVRFLLLALFSLVASGSSRSAFVAPSRSVHTKTTASRGTNTASPFSRVDTQRPAQRDAPIMMAGLLEKEGTGPAILDRPEISRQERAEDPVKERKGLGSEAWEVRIYNDGLNTREHVARSLVQVTGMSEMGAYQTMMQAHQNGIAVVGRWVYEVAEMYHDALKTNGIVCDLVPVEEE
jgi:ATP-dependent Clp protease adaptor protein ClpS